MSFIYGKKPLLILVIGTLLIPYTIYSISEDDKMQHIFQVFQVRNEKELIDKAELLQEIQKTFQINSPSEAIDVFTTIEDKIHKQTEAIYQTIANALNSTTLQTMIDQNKDAIADPKTIKELNQTIYDAIFELKRQLFESNMVVNSYAQPLIQQLDAIIKAVQRKAPYEELISLIPGHLPEKPNLDSIPRDELISAIKNIKIN